MGATGSTSQGQFRLITLDIRDAGRLQGFPENWSSEAVTLDGDKFRERRRWLLVGNAVNVRAAAWLGERLASPRSWAGRTRLAARLGRGLADGGLRRCVCSLCRSGGNMASCRAT